jgi:peptide-methionine (S)-S-oxide reductase
MKPNRSRTRAILLVLLAACGPGFASCAERVVVLPAPQLDESASERPATENAVFAGGCFWGVQKVFQHVKGVQRAVSGYAGGNAQTAEYEIVSTGSTGHAESVQVTFDPAVVSYGTLLRVFFSVAHDPTELNYQGPDHGTQYRSEIFTQNEAQKRIAEAYVRQLDQTQLFGQKIVTRIEPLAKFYPAEGYHQDYATLHPDSPYIAMFDLPKVRNLEHIYPELYRRDPVLVASGR